MSSFCDCQSKNFAEKIVVILDVVFIGGSRTIEMQLMNGCSFITLTNL